MARENNFLLGNGERLTYNVEVVGGGGDKNPPYDFETAKTQVAHWLHDANRAFSRLPDAACPGDEVVAVITMHPRYISKSEFPKDLLEATGLRTIGGKSRVISPRAWGIKKHPQSAVTDEYFVAGKRSSFLRWAETVENWSPNTRGAVHLQHLEQVSAFMGTDKVRSVDSDGSDTVFEVVLHDSSQHVLSTFQKYAEEIGATVIVDKSRAVRGLIFVPVRANSLLAQQIADYSFVRVVRTMPKLRLLQPSITRVVGFSSAQLPSGVPVAQGVRVAIFDGGIPLDSPLARWVTPIDVDGIGAPVSDYQEHGIAVTSALLFGPLSQNGEVPQPLCQVQHYRVLDQTTGANGDYEYYDVLDRILKVLDDPGNEFDFVNISLGPALPVDDDEVTRWTSSLDERFLGDKTVVTVAAGNDGERDAASGLNRIQPPADGVNVLAIGATDNMSTDNWRRAPYSCVGPGRRPGLVKPDAVIFGGTHAQPFFVLGPGRNPSVQGVAGTSFAAPYALRTGIAIRAQLGTSLRALAIRALMIHRAEMGDNELKDVGWGRLESDFSRIITCDDDETLVVFQDELPLGQYLRAPIPVPEGKLSGLVTVSATLVIAPEVDPSFPNAYTRGGLEVVFRPNALEYNVGKDGTRSHHPKSRPFFNKKNLYKTAEYELRSDAHKWETCVKASQTLRGSSLYRPSFDIYYHHRGNSAAITNPQPIPYALVVSLKAPKVPDLYDQVVRTYAHQLVQLRPQTRIQVR